MWGTGNQLVHFRLGQRFIPTHVGNRLVLDTFFTVIAVHPHACGEQYSVQTVGLCVPGSSPRMWGTEPR